MTASKTARFSVRRADLDVATGAVRAFVEAITADEPGTRFYATFTAGDDPVDFLHVMVFEDPAEEVHRTSAAARRFTDALYPVTIDGVRFDEVDLLATTSFRAG